MRVRMRFGCGSDAVVRRWLGRVFGSGADSLAEVQRKWFAAVATFRGPDSRIMSELCVLIIFSGRDHKMLPKPGFSKLDSVTPQGPLNWTGPIAKNSKQYVASISGLTIT